jgi:hypothetical protein
MIEAAIASLAGIAGILLWWLKNRAKTRRQIDDEQIEYARRLREKELDSWWTRNHP